MSSKDGLPQQYNASMAYYKLGYAFHDPESSLEVKPGACGYILENGSFHPIVNIGNAKATNKAGYTAIDRTNLIKIRPDKRCWGPKFTETVNHTHTGITAGATPLPSSIPLEATGMVEFSLNSDFGAVLLCDGEVSRQGYDHAEPFRQWVRANAGKLLVTFPKKIRTHGFYVVLTTYTTQEALMKSWHSRSHK
jgi:hypothetical protein